MRWSSAAFRAGGPEEVAGLPPEEVRVAQQPREVGDGGGGAAAGEGGVGDPPLVEEVLPGGDVAVGDRLRRLEGRRGDYEADRLQVAEPLLVGEKLGVACHRRVPGYSGKSSSKSRGDRMAIPR